MKHNHMVFSLLLVGAVLMGCGNPAAGDPPVSDAAAVASAKVSLAIDYAGGDDAGSVSGDLGLPATEGDGVSVTWASDAPATVSIAGVVARPGFPSPDAAVTLTATLTRGDASDTKAFTLTVLADTASFIVEHDWTTFGSVTDATVYAVIRDGERIYAGTSSHGLLYSDDNGVNWSAKTEASGGLASNQVYAIGVSGDLVIIGTFSGLTVWNRATGVDSMTNYLAGKQVSDVCVSGGKLYLAASDGVYYAPVTAISGLTLAETSFEYPESIFISGDKLYVVGASRTINVEELNVFSVSDMSASPAPVDVVPGVYSTIGPVYVNGDVVVVAADYQFYRSSDAGSTFSAVSDTGGGTIEGLAYDGSCLYAVKYGSSLWYSTDQGSSWRSVVLPDRDSLIANGISFDGSRLLLAYNDGVVVGNLE